MAIQSNETLKGLDYYSAATDTQLQCFKNNGISFVCRYYTSNTTRLSNGRTAIKNYFLGVQDAMNEILSNERSKMDNWSLRRVLCCKRVRWIRWNFKNVANIFVE
ncbi:hypothetical protein U473_07900 [Tepidibacillus decaturensis]|uniref:Uncharacterized protein n=1 Tax=Tepidibacillus decaturensis TaxID=1413211 RepID=A0A135L4V2_9BACI|nr:hypothetical protein U473_07900 [Tepidibacillus decaturensis]